MEKLYGELIMCIIMDFGRVSSEQDRAITS